MLFCFVILEQIFSQKGMCGMILLELCALILHKKVYSKAVLFNCFGHIFPTVCRLLNRPDALTMQTQHLAKMYSNAHTSLLFTVVD